MNSNSDHSTFKKNENHQKMSNLTLADLRKMKKHDFVVELNNRGLDTNGKLHELRIRLMKALENEIPVKDEKIEEKKSTHFKNRSMATKFLQKKRKNQTTALHTNKRIKTVSAPVRGLSTDEKKEFKAIETYTKSFSTEKSA